MISGLSLYAIATLAVISQSHEIGIRMAMGAQRSDILLLMLCRSIRTLLIGLPFGFLLALVISKILSSVLFHVNVFDPFAWVISCVLLISITIIVALIPALRTIRVSPLDVIREK